LSVKSAAIALVAALSLLASADGASSAKLGERCGGIAGPRCAEGLWCDLAPGMCHVADITGSCAGASEVCAEIFQPVCGCDGRTYANDCLRKSKQVQLSHRGRC
jgi:Kazal-type serine protease inhibitor domain